MLTKTEIDAMSADESIELAVLLWDHAHEAVKTKPLTEEQKRELDRRLAYTESHPGSTVPWEEFMKKYSH
jgi:putative addiction module component (TIGR02574 family)